MSYCDSHRTSVLIKNALTLVAAWCVASAAMASSPNLGNVMPRGGQRGAELDVLFQGARLADAQEIMFYRPGLTVTKLEVVNPTQVKAHVKIAPDCPLGECPLRVRTASGVSELGTFYVGTLPAVDEVEPNNDFDKPQKVALNSTITGIVQNEDVDYYLVEAKQGQRITAEVEGIRLGNAMFDPYVAIMDMGRFELAAKDDTALLLQDSIASVVAPKDGTYVIQVRESSYGGAGNCFYRVHVGTFPRPTGVVPAGGKIGEEVTIRFLGDVGGEFEQKFKLPAARQDLFNIFAQQGAETAPSPNWLRVTDFGNVIETEPNNDIATANVSDQPLPLAYNGVIAQENDADFFKFKATKGQAFDIHVYARRLRSPLDSVLIVYNSAGGGLASNDDSGGPDSYLRFQAPADGEYLIRVADHLNKGGPDYFYRVEFQPIAPSLTLSIPEVGRYSRERWAMAIPRGNRFMTLMSATRVNFGGDLVIAGEGLPPGVTIHAEAMPANSGVVPVVFEAAADAPVGGKLIDLFASHVDPNQKIRGSLSQREELVRGFPNATPYYGTTVDRLAVAVTNEAPFKVTLVEPKAPLVHNGSMNLKVLVERKPDFKAPVAVYLPFRPPGFGAASEISIPGDQSEGLYPINANTGAQPRSWKMCVLAQATVGDGPLWVSSQLVTVEIAPPFVDMKIEMAATEQGKPVEVVCKLDQKAPFDGNAKVTLVGLPPKTATVEKEVNKDAKEVVFPITVDPTSPVGQHKTLFCQLILQKNGEPVIHNIGHGGVLRIDPPPPPKPNAPPAPAAPAAPVAAAAPAPMPAAAPVKRLTRLEQLRLEQEERAKAAKAGK